ncbi:MAG: HAMP domain-containing protein [Treponema sp.]|jgi:adenylate cyclase|nr:HAMP domain-containing protein [Treponema sp.]
MSSKSKRRDLDKIRFSIGAKLITIISIIVVLSLGSITALVSWLVQTDLQISAEENNFEMNRRSALEAEAALVNVRSNSRIFIQTINSQSPNMTNVIRQSTDFFFSENPQISAVFFIVPGRGEQLFVNERFFLSKEMDAAMARSYFDSQREALGRSVRGETLLQNAAPHFERPLLVLFFPWQNGGVGGVLFSSDSLNENFGSGINQSFMLNSDGDILLSSDFALVKEGENVAGLEVFRTILDSPSRNRQQLLEAYFGVLQQPGSNSGIFTPLLESIKSILPFKKTETNDIDEEPTRKFVAYTKLGVAGAVVITSIEFDKVFEGIYATTRRNIYLTISVLSISVIFIWFFSKSISIPLRALAKAARKIEGGEFDIELRSAGKDEIGVLTSSFKKMSMALNIFGRFTNKEIAVKAMRGEIKPGGLPKHATIFFSDIREFTAKSESFTKYFGAEASDKIVYWLNSYFTQMVECVEKTNGVVDKFIGDAVMAHWGTAYSAGSPRKDAFNAVKSALMMRKALYYLNKSRKVGDPASPLIRIGCGLNTGIVTAGQLGSDLRMEYTVIGDPVNLASRIEALTNPLKADILISEDTWNLVGDRFICQEMPSVSVKGKAKPVRIFAVINFAGEPKGPQTIGELRDLLGLEAPELDNVNVNEDEKKYKIGTEAKNE